MKKFFSKFTLLLLLVLAPSLGYAKIGSRNLEEEQKLKKSCFMSANTGSPSYAASTPGALGIVYEAALNGVTAFDDSDDIAGFPHPARLAVYLTDNGTGNALSCASVTLVGRDQFGNKISEILSTSTGTAASVTENATNEGDAGTAADGCASDYQSGASRNCSRKVFSRLTRVIASACAEANHADDGLVIKMSRVVGLGSKINSAQDVEFACMISAIDAGANSLCANYDTNAATSDILGQVSVGNSSVDIAAL